MPRSKRDKKVSLTKTGKKRLELKQKIVEDVRNCVSKFESIYVFSYRDIRNNHIKGVREEWKGSRFFFAKNRVIALGLGRTKEEEIEDNLHKIAHHIKGTCGLLFTDCKKKDVIDWFENFSVQDFARSGYKIDTTIKLKEGPLKEFSHSLEPHLRQLGLPTKLDRGVVTLIKDHVVCKKGDILTPEQASLLELLGHKLATFKLVLRAMWTKPGHFEKICEEEEEEQEEEEDQEMEDDAN